jgi:hypothetical protein
MLMNTQVHQDDLQFWLLEHKNSKTSLLTDYAIINKLHAATSRLQNASQRLTDAVLTPQEAMEIALKISVDAFILAEKIKP